MTSQLKSFTREATLTLLLRQGESSASQLAAQMGISVQCMRRHLRNLQEEALVAANQIPLVPGRPSNLWQITTKGENYFNDSEGSQKFAIELITAMHNHLPPESISNLLNKQAEEKARCYRAQIVLGAIYSRLQKLNELRKLEVYLSELYPSETDSQTLYLNAFHCSILDIAQRHPIVCDHELEMIRKTFHDCKVERTKWRIESGHSCFFRLL